MTYKSFNQDCLTLMPNLESESIDIICIDPPYKYLKNQKLETDFNELKFFTEAKRLLIKDGFIIMFGRGTSFYRMNCILSDLGFTFKEEIIWDKSYSSSPLSDLSRVHETISIFTKGKGIINKSKVPYLEMKSNDFESIKSDIKRLKTILSNSKSKLAVLDYLDTGVVKFDGIQKQNYELTGGSDSYKSNDRCVSVVKGMKIGMTEKSIIKSISERYSSIHPTQKPVRLLERLLILCLPDKHRNEIVIADFFAGSFSTAEAIYNLGCNSIICEIDNEYFDLGNKRITNHIGQQKLF